MSPTQEIELLTNLYRDERTALEIAVRIGDTTMERLHLKNMKTIDKRTRHFHEEMFRAREVLETDQLDLFELNPR